MKNIRSITTTLSVAAFCLQGCSTYTASNKPEAVAIVSPTQGNNAHGTVTFTQLENGVKIVAHLEGLTPGQHGFHVHEKGDCSAPDAASAGGHYNPDSTQHGGHDASMRHVGDLGNITADKNGKAHLSRIDRRLSLDGMHSIVGRSVIVHAKADDLSSQPAGNAGPRIGCGAIVRK